MNIAIIGYGRMGKTIERLAKERDHQVVLTISSANSSELNKENLKQKEVEVAIEFSLPHTVVNNLEVCFDAGIPVACGTTAWLKHWDDVLLKMTEKDGTFLYASNFSIGVNIFFAINDKLAQMMNNHKEYKPTIHEIHHTSKLDAPSGTAITLGKDILNRIDRLTKWVQDSPKNDQLAITSTRIDPTPGTHHVKYSSHIDDIELIHTANSRDGFAMGAIIAAEYIFDKKGLFSMADVLDL